MAILDFTKTDLWNVPLGQEKLGIPTSTDALPQGAQNLFWSQALFDAAFAAAFPAALEAASGVPLVPAARQVLTTAPLTGGGDLSVDRTLSMPQASATVDGYLSAADFASFSAADVPPTRQVATAAPLSGGGDLSTNRTISIAKATAAVDGYLSAADFTTLAAKVAGSRTLNTTAPLTGGGDLSSDRTFAIPAATNSVDGYLTSGDHTTFAAKESALTFSAPLSRTTNTISIPVATALANGYLSSTDWGTFNAKVSTARSIATTSPLTGGGDLSADRTIAGDFTLLWTWTAINIATTPTDRIQLSNTQAAISGTQQYSPAIRLTGQGFDSTSATSKASDWRIYNKPVQFAGGPEGAVLFDYSFAGGAFTTYLTILANITGANGTLTFNGNITAQGNFTLASSGNVLFGTRGFQNAPSDGVLTLFNNGGSSFGRLQFGGTTSSFPALARSTTTLKVRLADDSADAGLLCGAFTASGNLSFFGAAAVGQQTSGANLTNNVTSGGTDDTIANYTDLTLYANDAAAIRNNIYQLARKVKQLNDGLRALGLFT